METKSSLNQNGDISTDAAGPKNNLRFQRYLTALRPWSFCASLTPVILGGCLSYKMHEKLDPLTFGVVCMTALSVHSAGNLVNTYYDFIKGVDTKKSDDKTIVAGNVSANDVATLGGICYGIGCLGLFILCAISPAQVQHLSLIYFCGLSGSFMYTGGLGLKYIALGDIVIFLTFGPLTVMFAYLAMTGNFSVATIPYAIPLALNIECILHANNCRDRIADKSVGIVTLAIIIGPSLSYVLFCVLLFGPYIAFAYITLNFSRWFLLPTLTVIRSFAIERKFRSGNMVELPQDIAKLNMILGITFVFAVIYSEKNSLPFVAYF